MARLICFALLMLLWTRGISVAAAAEVRADGELGARIGMVHHRFAAVTDPAFTDDFILADVALRPEYPRRFSDYSGDLSGRYIEAMSVLPPAEGPDLGALVRKAIACQRADGRFGNESLVFAPAEIGRAHMALLWGNGRLLAGLMEYYNATRDEAVLASARRLGDFLLSVREPCSTPEVAQRLVEEAASGYICFTQLIEGLVLLYRATGEPAYLAGAESMALWFQRPRGTQHTHGYLTTVRSLLSLYEVTKKPELLQLVEETYADAVASPDYLIYGGFPEYFGNPNNRDEGCSEADFVRLSLGLWRVTGKMDYLDRAERCLVNQFFGNQFDTGDFGHRALSNTGMDPIAGAGRAWWCCTMHGLRAFRDVLDSLVTLDGDTARVNLFQDAEWSDGPWSLALWRNAGMFEVTVNQAPTVDASIAIRQPAWSEGFRLMVNGERVMPIEDKGYVVVQRTWKPGDVLSVAMQYRLRLVTRDGKELSVSDLGESPVEAAVFYGPWLLGVDGALDPMFFGEPWGENEIPLSDNLRAENIPLSPPSKRELVSSPLEIPEAELVIEYRHGGFPEPCHVTLRPISEQSRHDQSAFAVWLRVRKPF